MEKIVVIFIILTVINLIFNSIFRDKKGDVPVIFNLFICFLALILLIIYIAEPLPSSRKLLLFILVMINIPVYYYLFRFFFGSWDSFKDMYYREIGCPFWEHYTRWYLQWGRLLLTFWLVIPALIIAGEYFLLAFLLWKDTL